MMADNQRTKNWNGVTVAKGNGMLETDEDCRRYMQDHIQKTGSILKVPADKLPNGHNY